MKKLASERFVKAEEYKEEEPPTEYFPSLNAIYTRMHSKEMQQKFQSLGYLLTDTTGKTTLVVPARMTVTNMIILKMLIPRYVSRRTVH